MAVTVITFIAKPVVLPETFDGTKNWDNWYVHFENVAAVSGWDDAVKLKWLRVRLTGQAQKALHRLPEASRATYVTTRTGAFQARQPSSSRSCRHVAHFSDIRLAISYLRNNSKLPI